MKKFAFIFIITLLLSGLLICDQSFNIKIGLFHPSQDSDLWAQNRDELIFNKADMLNIQIALEYEKFINKLISIAIEGGYYDKEYYTQFQDWEFTDGSPILHNIGLEIAYLEVDLKFYILGHKDVFNPYIGGGVGVYYWNYIQWGDFIDEIEGTVLEDQNAQTSTYTPGANLKGGFVLKVNRRIGLSFEAKYQYLKGELSSFFEGFDKFDLSGLNYRVGLSFMF